MPVLIPIVKRLGYGPIRLGTLFGLDMQVASPTPPFASAALRLESVAPPGSASRRSRRSLRPFVLQRSPVPAPVPFLTPYAHVRGEVTGMLAWREEMALSPRRPAGGRKR